MSLTKLRTYLLSARFFSDLGNIFYDVLFITGAGVLSYGLYMISPPYGFIAAGIIFMAMTLARYIFRAGP